MTSIVGMVLPAVMMSLVLHLPRITGVVGSFTWWLFSRWRSGLGVPDWRLESPEASFAAALRRLSDDLELLEHSVQPALAARIEAARLAYDDELLVACRSLGIPAPDRGPLDPVERLQCEAALSQHGLVW